MFWFSKKEKRSKDDTRCRIAVIDIGSNSIRLVVYDGPKRVPSLIFNEKVMAGLGRALADTGAIDPDAMRLGLSTLARFKQLCAEMEVEEIHCVATAAVREASNGSEFATRAEELGLNIKLISGTEEAELAGLGVISAIPDANGIVGDLGGGSLELAQLRDGKLYDRISLPVGVLRVAGFDDDAKADLKSHLGDLIAKTDWLKGKKKQPLYLVGGSWRALARFDMHQSGYPLPVIHHYSMPPERAGELVVSLADVEPTELKAISSLSNSRIPTMSDAALLLDATVQNLKSQSLIVSAYGLREGLIYQRLTEDERQVDPLIIATEASGADQARFPANSRLLGRWIAGIFSDDTPEMARLRAAACNLGDVAWRANPDFRAERGLEIAKHGNWVGIDGRGRELIGQAVFTSFGGGQQIFPDSGKLASEEDMRRAISWGLAMRLGQRLSAGTRQPLDQSRLKMENGVLQLRLGKIVESLEGEAVTRRLNQLASALGVTAEIKIIKN